MAVSRPSAAVSAGSASSLWNAKDAARVDREVRQALVAKGDFSLIERTCLEASETARAGGDIRFAGVYLDCAGGAQLAQFKYGAALNSLVNARDLLRKSGDRVDLAGVLLNLSSLYQQLWDMPSARQSGKEAWSVAQGLPNFPHRPGFLLQLGRLQPEEADAQAESYFRQGIELAKQQGNAPGTEARGLDLLGDLLDRRGEFTAALEAHQSAYRLRIAKAPAEKGFSYYYLAEANLHQGNLIEAARWNDLALRVAAGKPSFPAYRLHHQRGLVLAAGGNLNDALAEFRSTVDLAQASRRGFLPAMSSLDRSNAGLEEAVFDSFVESAATAALARNDQQLARESFLAAEANRAESLRQSIELRDVWRSRLPMEYWETLAALRSEESNLLAHHQARSALSDRFELKLSELEARAGLDFSHEKIENFRAFRSLKHILEGLRETEVLLSFHLGKEQSFLWAVTRNSLRLYPLASRNRIRESVKEFRDAVQQASPDAAKLGSELYRELFGNLRKDEESKPSWLLSLEDALFELPFGALLPETADQPDRSRPVYLVERNSIQIIPGAFSLRQEAPVQKGQGRLVAVGDPIYNTADPRWEQDQLRPDGAFRLRPAFFRAPEAAATVLNRLAGSGREAEMVAQTWGSARSTLLMGSDARRESFVAALKQDRPQVIHLATHALAARSPQPKAFLALGLGPDHRPDLLSETDIGTLNVPGALVVLTGCATATGDILAGAGLEGMTEAWTAAGARAVVATEWAVPDQTGAFLPRFYRALATSSTAESLQQAQVAMIHSGTAYSSPSVWASYQLFGGAR